MSKILKYVVGSALVALVAVMSLISGALATTFSTVTASSYACNGVQTAFTVNFPYASPSDVVATVATSGVTSTLALTTDYRLSAASTATTATLTTTAASKCPNGSTLKISRSTALTQPTSLRTQGEYSPATIEASLDRATRQLQEIRAMVGVPITVPDVSANTMIIAASSTKARSLADRFADVVNVKDFDAKGDGFTDDTAAIQAAINVAVTTGAKRVVFEGGRTYYLGTAPTSVVKFDVSGGAASMEFDGQGCEFVIQTTGGLGTAPFFFRIYNPVNVVFRNMRFRDTGANLAVDWIGASAIVLTASGASDSGNVLLENIRTNSMLSLLTVYSAGGATGRIRGITVLNSLAETTYYGINCQEQGDGLRTVNFRGTNVRRIYFVYGVQNHDVDLIAKHDGVALGANSLVLVKRYLFDTKSIRLKLQFNGSTAQYTNLITFEHQPTSGVSRISDIYADLSLGSVSSTMNPNLFHFSSLTAGGVTQTSTANIWEDISLEGHIPFYSFGGPTPIKVDSIPTTEATVSLGTGLQRSFDRTAGVDGGFQWRLAMDREMRMVYGDLSARTIDIPIGNGLAFTVRLKIWCHDDYNNLFLQNTGYEEHLVTGYNSGGGAVVVQKDTLVTSHSQGIAPTSTIAGVGENLRVSFAGGPYSVTSSMARVDAEWVGAFRW